MEARAVLMICPPPLPCRPLWGYHRSINSWTAGAVADPLHSLTEHHPAPNSSFPPPVPQLWSHPTTEPREKSRVLASSVPPEMARPLRSGTPAASPKRCGCSVEEGIGFHTRCGNGNLMTSCMSAHRKTTKKQRSGSISCSFFLCCNQTKEQ